MDELLISKVTQRRFMLGKQGLWPGRRWSGKEGLAQALYYLWLVGEVMVHHRERFERVSDLREKLFPPEAFQAAPEKETEFFFARKSISFLGLIRQRGFVNSLSNYLQHKIAPAEGQQILDNLITQGQVSSTKVEGSKETWYFLNEDQGKLLDLEAGKFPTEWLPVETSNGDEVAFLAPLDIVSARGRSKWLFDFEYVWEVYKPAH